eukprot:gene645-8148_t
MNKKKLLKDIINDQFGDEKVGKVGSFLVDSGVQTLQNISKFVKLPSKSICESLSILIHHNICKFYNEDELMKILKTKDEIKEYEEIKQSKKDKGETTNEFDNFYYQILPSAILMKYRLAQCIQLIKNDFGQYSEFILETLSEYGRLTVTDLLDKTLTNYQSKQEYLSENDEKRIKLTFEKMVQERYISRVEKINFEITNPIKLKNITKNDNPKNKPITNAPIKKSKKRKIDDLDEEETVEDSENKKQKMDEDMGEILWMINFDQFIRKFRHEEIIQHVNHKINATCATILSKVIQLVAPYEKQKNDALSRSVRFQEIYSGLAEDEDISETNLERYLELLCNEGILQLLSGQNGGSYSVRFDDVCTILKRQHAENIVEQKYGVIGGRIFRLLLIKKQLEEKQITQFAMLPPSEARSLLFRLFQDNLLQLQEVPKTSDHHPTRTFYLWNVHLETVYQKLIEDMFKTVLNLRLRHSAERNKVLSKIGGGDVSNIALSLSVEQDKLLERFGKVEVRLEFSILHLMNLIMQFEEFNSD